MRKSQEKTINGVQYRVTQLGGKEASRMGFLLGQMMVKFGAAASKADFSAMAEAMTLEQFERFRDTLSPFTEVLSSDGKAMKLSDIFDVHFAGDPGAIMDWFIFSMEVNFSDFLSSAVSKLAAMWGKKATPQASSSPQDTPVS